MSKLLLEDARRDALRQQQLRSATSKGVHPLLRQSRFFEQRVKRLLTLDGSSGVPFGVVKTRSRSLHISPAILRSNAWRSR